MQRTVLIVGGTSGLGRRLAEFYSDAGARVIIIGRRKHLLDEISSQSTIEAFQLDISSPACNSQLETLLERIGQIDILILAASVVEFNPGLSFLVEEKTIAVNVQGYAAVLNAAYHYFLKRGQGHIVGVTSIASARGNKTAPAYNASKAFQTSYLEGLRLKLLMENQAITVTEIVPGYIDTQMAKGERLFWMAPLDKAARMTMKAIARKKRRAFITRRWWLVYQVYKYLPSLIYTYLINSSIKLKQKT